MAWRRPGDKPLSEPIVDSLLTHITLYASLSLNELMYHYGQYSTHLDPILSLSVFLLVEDIFDEAAQSVDPRRLPAAVQLQHPLDADVGESCRW